MARSLKPGRAAASRAAKILRDPMSTKGAKTTAAKTLAKRSSSGRTVKSAPKPGKVGQKAIKRAVNTVRAKRLNGSKRR